MAQIVKQNFSGFDLSKLQASLYDIKVAHGTTEHLARFVGWESRSGAEGTEDLALFALRMDSGEQVRKLVLPNGRIDDPRQLKLLFTLVFSRRAFENEELVPTQHELEMVK
jgi:hypothetical protein